MNKKASDKTAEPVVVEPVTSKTEMDELKREMRSAEWNHWAEKNMQSLLVAAGLVVVGLIAGGMWLEHSHSRQDAAANLYEQALGETDAAKKTALLESLAGDFSSSSYAAMAQLQLIATDSKHADAHYQALIGNSSAMDEWKWQARLDLAQLKIEQGDAAAAHTLLKEPVGKEYQQLRYFLLAGIAKDDAEKKKQLQKALDAAAPDQGLKQRIESQLAGLAS
ncbi:YfgM family protein [Mariprofundus ferrooxydans]|uniref:YfgM family protein n=1 Tax=Mariprofundus ferrooxydans TaxID=314344 RepID=UPI00037D9D95|nr:tetratricopeptide repeat protein [Mariprofundus ferrooxydans]